MRILLDTHAFLWFFTNDPKLSLPALSQIADRANEVLISPASYWEVAIKVSLGKYPLSVSFEQFWTAGIRLVSLRTTSGSCPSPLRTLQHWSLCLCITKIPLTG